MTVLKHVAIILNKNKNSCVDGTIIPSTDCLHTYTHTQTHTHTHRHIYIYIRGKGYIHARTRTHSQAKESTIRENQNKPVNKMTDYSLENQGSIPGRCRDFIFATPGPALRSTQPPIQWVQRTPTACNRSPFYVFVPVICWAPVDLLCPQEMVDQGSSSQ
jgi:hypothetical protein